MRLWTKCTVTVFNISGLSDVMFFFLEKAQFDFQQLIFRNVQPEQVTEGEGCDEPKCSDRPCDQSCDHEEEEEPLMKTNNYQFCWVWPKTGKPIWLVNKQWESWISRGTAARRVHRTVAAISFFCFLCLSFFFSCLSAGQTSCCRTNMWLATLYSVTTICHATKRGPTERTHGDKSHKQTKLPCFRYLSFFQYTYTSLLQFCLKGECSQLSYTLRANVLLVSTVHPTIILVILSFVRFHW